MRRPLAATIRLSGTPWRPAKKSLAAILFRSKMSASVESPGNSFENRPPSRPGAGSIPAGLSELQGIAGQPARLRADHYLLNAMSDGVLALDTQSRIQYTNTTACRMLGYAREDLSGHPVREIIADTISPDVTPQQLYDPVLTNGELVSTDTARFRRSDGSLFQVMLTAIPVTDPGFAPAEAGDVDISRVLNRVTGAANPDDAPAAKAPDSATIQGLLLVFRDVTPGLYLSLGRINQLLTRLMTRQDAQSTIEAALHGVAEIVQADFALLGAYEKESDTIHFDTRYAAEYYTPPDSAQATGGDQRHAPPAIDSEDGSLRLPSSETPYSYIYHNRNPLRIDEYAQHSLAQPEFVRMGAASLLATPVLAESRLMGVVYFFRTNQRQPFSDADLENLRALGPVLSAAFFKADHETRLTELATTDPLTGLLNRRVVFEKIREEIDRATRYESDFSALMIDLDFFKEINDAYGHLAGDRVLREVALTLGGNTRSADAVARTGGEEFIILLPETALEGAVATAEKIRDRIQELRIGTETESTAGATKSGAATTRSSTASMKETISVTASIGCACHRKGENGEEFYARLDRLLYGAKQAGRNRISS